MAVAIAAAMPCVVVADVVSNCEIYSSYTYAVGKVIDTADRVYFTSDGNLYVYDKESTDLHAYNQGNGLSGTGISGIWHDGRDCIAVAYDDSNIDFIYDDGQIVNMSDIRDADLNEVPTINDMAFDGNAVYAAGAFGIVRIDRRRHSVVESGRYGREVKALAVPGGRLIAAVDDGLYLLKKGERINTFDNFDMIAPVKATTMMEIDKDKAVAGDYGSGVSQVVTFDFDNLTAKTSPLAMDEPLYCQHGTGGLTMMSSRYQVMMLDAAGKVKQNLYIPAELSKGSVGARIATRNGVGSVWWANGDGLCNLSTDDMGQNLKYTMAPVKPRATSIDGGIYYIVQSAGGDVYVSNRCASHLHTFSAMDSPMAINRLRDGEPADITPDAEKYAPANPSAQGRRGRGFRPAVDPDDDETLYVPTWYEGIIVTADGEITERYDWNNSPFTLTTAGRCLVESVDFDSDGNLWAVYYDIDATRAMVAVLPAAKRKAGSVKAGDWVVMETGDFGHFSSYEYAVHACATPRWRQFTLITEGREDSRLMVVKRGSDITDRHGMSAMSHTIFTDQDGRPMEHRGIYAMAEDRDGNVWLGTGNGIAVIHDLEAMLTTSGRVERVKVPRNDGTNYADYLLDGITVTGIAVDGANRKWISTAGSGIYVVSADGREIIDNITLPYDADALCVAADRVDNKVYVGTQRGLICYDIDASPPHADFESVKVYPNPVRPEYTGQVIIDGLMEGTLVKIADPAGNVVYQTRSEGGMASWNVCSSSGRRVSSGVYYVLGSADDGIKRSGGVVAKILVVN